ncbi:MAG: photosystem I reaction center subunit PsaK [Synechococcales bacterium]|nr:photosystem I reaction center subunit PsaK [Synechococcales bacterium]
MHLALLLADVPPPTPGWSPKIAAIMIVCNILAIAFGRLTMEKPNEGPKLPASAFFGGMGLPGLLATTSFGHIIGAGVILGLTNLGVI